MPAVKKSNKEIVQGSLMSKGITLSTRTSIHDLNLGISLRLKKMFS